MSIDAFIKSSLLLYLLKGVFGLIVSLSVGGCILYFLKRCFNSDKFFVLCKSSVFRILIVLFFTLAHLPARWVIGQIGPIFVNFAFLLASPFFIFFWCKAVGNRLSFLKDISIILIFFISLALFYYGSWYTPKDLLLNLSNDILIPNQSDLPPHYSLQQNLAFSHNTGLYWSPLGYPDKITKGSYGASIFSAIFSFNATLGNHAWWSISIARLGIFFYFFLACFSIFCCTSLITRLTSFKKFGKCRLSFCAGLVAVFIFCTLANKTHGSNQWLTEIFIHSINNGAGIGVFFLVFSVLMSLNYFAEGVLFKQFITTVVFLALCMSVLLFHRANWIFFYSTFFFAVIGIKMPFRVLSLYKIKNLNAGLEKLFENFGTKKYSILLVFTYSVFVVLAFFKTNIFGFPSIIVGTNNSIVGASSSWLHYYEWYPTIHLFLLKLSNYGNSPSEKLLIQLIIEVMIGLVIWIGARLVSIPHNLCRALAFGSLGLAASRFVVRPIFDGYHFGSTEPLGNSHLLIRFLFFFLASVSIAAAYRSRVGRLAVVVFGAWLLVLLPRGLESAPGYMVLKRDNLFLDIRDKCLSREAQVVWAEKQEVAVLSGCAVVGEWRYSKKLSAGDSRSEFVRIAREECRGARGLRELRDFHPGFFALCR